MNWHPRLQRLRRFGISMLFICGIFAGILYLRELHTLAYTIAIFGIANIAFAVTKPALILPIYWVWMAASTAMAFVIGPIILAVIYYGLVTPIALLGRLTRRDRLKLRRQNSDSYWLDTPASGKAFERQF